jgi:Ca2+-binding EF-hand superfamily protein
MPVFADLDQDGDSFISNDEFLAFHAARIQERAQQGREMKNAANATAFVDMDLDGDGRLSRDEFAAHQAQMRAGGHCCGM